MTIGVKRLSSRFYSRQYISGIDGKFHPNDDITREGVASIIDKMIGGETTATVDFKDVKGRWSGKSGCFYGR